MILYFLSFQMGGRQWAYISDEGKDLVHRMLELDPDQRITIEDALQHPFIRVSCYK